MKHNLTGGNSDSGFPPEIAMHLREQARVNAIRQYDNNNTSHLSDKRYVAAAQDPTLMAPSMTKEKPAN